MRKLLVSVALATATIAAAVPAAAEAQTRRHDDRGWYRPAVQNLAPAFQVASHANPFFYVISGFRYGFVSEADSPILFGGLLLLALNVALATLCYALLKSGWKLKA